MKKLKLPQASTYKSVRFGFLRRLNFFCDVAILRRCRSPRKKLEDIQQLETRLQKGEMSLADTQVTSARCSCVAMFVEIVFLCFFM